MDQENTRCKELINQSDLTQESKDKYIKLLEGDQIHGKNQISVFEYSTFEEKLTIINRFNKYKTFCKTFSQFEIASFKVLQNNQNYVIVIQLQKLNGIDAIKEYRMNQQQSIQNQITSIKHQFNILFSSYLEFKEQFRNDELKKLCIHKIHSIPEGEFRISIIDKECNQQCTDQQNNTKYIQIQLIQQIAEAFNEEKRRQNSAVIENIPIRELEQYWKIEELKKQIDNFEEKNNQTELLLFGEFFKSELIPTEKPSLEEFFSELKQKLANNSPAKLVREIIKKQVEQFNQDQMKKFRDQIMTNDFTNLLNIDEKIYNKHFLVYLLIIQKFLLKVQTDEQRERDLLNCLRPYLQSQNYQQGLYIFCKSFDMSIIELDQIISKLDELQ